jgi:cyclopropane-fatty-acyl-phospholipid synthase
MPFGQGAPISGVGRNSELSAPRDGAIAAEDHVAVDDRWLKDHGASPAAVTSHYDVGNEFFGLWLDSELVYTAGLWDGPGDESDLEAAQLRKIDYYLEALRLAPGARLLDIGCGWGAALRRACTTHQTSAAVGLTLSPSQRVFAQSHPCRGVDVRVQDWVDFEPEEFFDGIISIEAIEAFARRGLSRREKVRIYRALFERAHSWLLPSGHFGLQMITYGAAGPDQFDQFIADAIFPESDLPLLSEVIEASEGLFELVSLRNDRQDYVNTLRLWLARLKTARAEARTVVPPEVAKRFEDYLRLSWRMFGSGACDLHRLVLRRIDRPRRAPVGSLNP